MSKLSMVEKNKKAKRKIDWVGIKNHYRAGLLSIREIASLHGISHTTIQRHVKAEGWTRDLKAKVHAKADALVLKQDNSEAVATSNSVESQTPQSEKVIVESNAKVIADVRLEHRAFMTRFRKIYEKLVAELEFQTESPELFERLGEWLSDKEDVGSKGLNNKHANLINKVVSFHSRIDSLKRLSDVLKTLITLERTVYGIVEPKESDIKPYEPKELVLTDWSIFEAKMRGRIKDTKI